MIFVIMNIQNPNDIQAYKMQAALTKVLGHPARLRILDILSHGEACVCHMTTVLGQRQPYVSQLLMSLRDADLVRDRREGSTVYYRLADSRIAAIISLTRDLLREREPELEWPALPEAPVEGCPCPRCAAAREWS